MVLKETILGRELRALDTMNNLERWMTSSTLGHDLKTLDAMNNLELLIISMTRDSVSSDLLMQ